MCECGARKTPWHSADECELTLKNREEILNDFKAVFMRYGWKAENEKSLNAHLSYTYFTARLGEMESKERTNLVQLLKKTVTAIVLSDRSGNSSTEGEKNQPEEDLEIGDKEAEENSGKDDIEITSEIDESDEEED